jgi:hypothetical protein
MRLTEMEPCEGKVSVAISLKHVTALLGYLNAILILANANQQCAPHKVAILIPESLRDFSWLVYHRFDMRICQRCQHYIPDDSSV